MLHNCDISVGAALSFQHSYLDRLVGISCFVGPETLLPVSLLFLFSFNVLKVTPKLKKVSTYRLRLETTPKSILTYLNLVNIMSRF